MRHRWTRAIPLVQKSKSEASLELASFLLLFIFNSDKIPTFCKKRAILSNKKEGQNPLYN